MTATTPANPAAPPSGRSATDWAIDLTDVSKVYKGGVHALRGIEMRVHRGEVFGLLGPNGAGKSTLVKILMTVIRATQARGTVLGDPVGKKSTLARVGYLPEHHRFPDYLTGRQVLHFYGSLAGTPRRELRRKSDELLELVNMTEWASKKVKGYSKGMRQRVGIAQALMNDPDLVVLDEPTDGVDPVGRREIREILVHLKEKGTTVFLNSHLLSELEMVCDRVAILVQGKVASQGTLEELTLTRRGYHIAIDPDSDPAAVWADALPGMADGVWNGINVVLNKDTAQLLTTDAAAVMPVIDRLRARGVTIHSFRPQRPSLEDLFMEAIIDPTTGKELGPGAAKGGRR